MRGQLVSRLLQYAIAEVHAAYQALEKAKRWTRK